MAAEKKPGHLARLIEDGKELPDRILIKPQEMMLDGVAVANAIKIWFERNPKQCIQAFSNTNLIQTSTVNSGTGEKTLTVNGRTYFLLDRVNSDGKVLPERCFTTRTGGKESYWLLDPGAKGNTRHMITTSRDRLRQFVDFINKSGQDRHCAICGMKIRGY